MKINNLMLNCVFCLLKSDYVYDLTILDEFEFHQKNHYFKPLSVYSILVQLFTEILQFQQHYGVNNLATITTMVITMTTIQHNLMQQYFQHLVLV